MSECGLVMLHMCHLIFQLQTSMNVGEEQTSVVRMPPAMTLLVATHAAVIQVSQEMGLTALVRKSVISDSIC